MIDDALIDLVARDLLGSEPPPSLRRRVLDRIAPSTPSGRRWLVPAMAVTAVAIVAVAVRHDWREATTPMPAVAALWPSATSDAAEDLSGTRTTEASITNAEPVEPPTVRPVFVDDTSWMEEVVPPLERPFPLEVGTIQPIELEMAPMTVDPIVTEPLVVPPLARGDGAPSRYQGVP